MSQHNPQYVITWREIRTYTCVAHDVDYPESLGFDMEHLVRRDGSKSYGQTVGATKYEGFHVQRIDAPEDTWAADLYASITHDNNELRYAAWADEVMKGDRYE